MVDTRLLTWLSSIEVAQHSHISSSLFKDTLPCLPLTFLLLFTVSLVVHYTFTVMQPSKASFLPALRHRALPFLGQFYCLVADIPATGGVSLRGIEVLSLGDDHAVEVTTKSTGRYSINVAKHESSKGNGFTPGGSKRQVLLSLLHAYCTDIHFSYTPPFVRNNFMGRRDDPFASTPSKAKRTSGGSFKSAEKESLMSRDWRSGSGRSGSSSNGSNHGTLLTYGGRAISGSNAQAYYPPAYCIFVAK